MSDLSVSLGRDARAAFCGAFDAARSSIDAEFFSIDDPVVVDSLNRAAARGVRVRVTVEGDCDERGTREYNLALGARRANAVKEYLVSLGVSAARVETISYGKEHPVCSESTEDCYAQNRRGVTAISGGANS